MITKLYYVLCNALVFEQAPVQEDEDDKREHDGEVIVLPGESGHSGNSGWEDLEEEIVGEGDEERERSTEEGNCRNSDTGDKLMVTPRNKRQALKEEDSSKSKGEEFEFN